MKMFAVEEIALWENEQIVSKLQIKAKQHKDPRRSKTREYRKGIKGVHYGKECTEVKRDGNRLYRTRMKQLMRLEQYDLLHDYQHTGGWITW
ncbi:hypothetical protein [Paenibacillus luteus]|uniref:hypothetical protein n=1 Tax=Paenibacillus luteus TaxID=2545753 RepID=UPI0015894649|nr:hypothetical protein [Paenibacillus luteus]